MASEVLRSRGERRVSMVNPGYDEVAGRPCLPELAALDEAPDLVLLGVGDKQLPLQLNAAASIGARSAVVFGSANDDGVRDRLRETARASGMALCGAGCMGFWNVRTGLRALGYVERDDSPVGPISVVTHSGSVFSTLLRTRQRLGFDLVVSSGQELVTTTADYVDHVVAATDTRLLALVLETVREGDRLRRSLRSAREAGVEVVLLPVGRSPLGAAMVTAHSGAVAGDDAAWEALCEDTGSIRVGDLAELADTLELFAAIRRPTRGRGAGLATVHDSGAERGLLVDLAHTYDVPLARIGEPTRRRLAAELDRGLDATNPLDVWGGGRDTRERFASCLTAMAADPEVGVTALAVDLVVEYDNDTSYLDAVLDAADRTTEPLAVLTNLASAIDEQAAARLRRLGVPVLEGTRSGLLALRHLLRPPGPPDPLGVAVDEARRARWRPRLPDLDAAGTRVLLADYGIHSPVVQEVGDAAGAVAAAARLGGPVVLKTATPGIAHRSEVGGVVPGVRGATAVTAAYDDLAARLGPRVTVHEQSPPGVELSIGLVRDAQLGPMLVVAAGGVLVELLADRAVALPPVSAGRARAMLDRLRVRPLLDGWRGAPVAALAAVDTVVLGLSQLAVELGDRLDALELNPVVVGPSGAIALDVLVVTRPEEPPCTG
jgi:acetate---CoA ligase (ADP-forming)